MLYVVITCYSIADLQLVKGQHCHNCWHQITAMVKHCEHVSIVRHWKPTAGCQLGRPVRHVQTAITVAVHVLEEHAKAIGIVTPLPRCGQRVALPHHGDAKPLVMLGLLENLFTNENQAEKGLLTIVGGCIWRVWLNPHDVVRQRSFS